MISRKEREMREFIRNFFQEKSLAKFQRGMEIEISQEIDRIRSESLAEKAKKMSELRRNYLHNKSEKVKTARFLCSKSCQSFGLWFFPEEINLSHIFEFNASKNERELLLKVNVIRSHGVRELP